MKRYVCLFILFTTGLFGNSYKYELSITAIFQNEARFLREWIEYHRLIGVQHFYLYNHNSNDNYQEILDPYIKNGIVDFVDFSQPGFPQNKQIEDALNKANGESKWLAIIDTDEFIFPKQHDTLLEFLTTFEDYAAISINWQCFGTSGISQIPDIGLMLEFLTMKAPEDFSWNLHVKCIVRPERVKQVINTHAFIFYEPYICVRPDKSIQNTNHLSDNIQMDILVLNHYWTRDEKFFYEVKVPRCQEIKGWTKEGAEYCNSLMNVIEDTEINFKYGERLGSLLH